MIIQEVFANDVQVEIIEAEDADYYYKNMTAISTTGVVQKELGSGIPPVSLSGLRE